MRSRPFRCARTWPRGGAPRLARPRLKTMTAWPTRDAGWLVQCCADSLADLLDGPVVAVGIAEEEELPAVPGVQRLDLRGLDATPGQLGAGGLDVGDDQLHAPARPGAGVRSHYHGPDDHRAGRPRGRHVHHPHSRRGPGVSVAAETQLVEIEALGPVNIGDRDYHDFQ